MSGKIWIGLGFLLLFALNVIVFLKKTRNDDPLEAYSKRVRSEEIQTYIHMCKLAPNHRPDNYFDGIGALVKGFWIRVLPLSNAQADAITHLDDVVWNSRVNSFDTDVDYLQGNPTDYREFVAHSNARRSETIAHAQLMVTLGLLIEPQVAFVTQRTLSGQRPLVSLRDMNMQVLLGIIEEQDEKISQVAEKEKQRKFQSSLMSPDARVERQNSAEMTIIQHEADAAAKEILTPEQREKWNQLAAKQTLPAEPPDLPVPTEAETAQIKLEKMSPIFRAVAENTELLGLSGEQKRLLKDLNDVTRLGLFWISHRDGKAPFPPGIDGSGQADPVKQTRDEFLKHAGQVALLGILTQQQAEEIEKAVKQN